MTIFFPPDPPPPETPSKSGKRGKDSDEDRGGSSKKGKSDDPSVIEIRLCDSDDEEADGMSTTDTSTLSTGSVSSSGSQAVASDDATAVPEAPGVNNLPQSNGREVYKGFYDEDMSANEVSTMIQRARVMIDFFAAGQMSHGRPFSEIEIEKIRNNVTSATFFSSSELNRLFKQVLLNPSVSTYFTVLVETIATIYYTEEDIKTDFLPQFMTRTSSKSKAYLGKPLRHYRSFQRCFMIIMGFKDPFEFDKLGLMRRVTKDLSRCRKVGFPSTKMMNNNRSASFKSVTAPSAAAATATTTTTSSSASARSVTFGPTSYR